MLTKPPQKTVHTGLSHDICCGRDGASRKGRFDRGLQEVQAEERGVGRDWRKIYLKVNLHEIICSRFLYL
jgi:hypothetical protein